MSASQLLILCPICSMPFGGTDIGSEEEGVLRKHAKSVGLAVAENLGDVDDSLKCNCKAAHPKKQAFFRALMIDPDLRIQIDSPSDIRSTVEASMYGQVVAKDLESALGATVRSIGVIYWDCEVVWPPGYTGQKDILETFFIEGFDRGFAAIGFQEEDHFAVVLVTTDRCFQVFPNKTSESFHAANRESAVELLKSEVITPFAMRMASMTKERFDRWFEKCVAEREAQGESL